MCTWLPLAAAYSNVTYANTTYTNATYNATAPFAYTTNGTLLHRGVNLGGWLVLEPYITPSLFLAFNATSGNVSAIPNDEYNFCKLLGSAEALRRLQQHWSTWYNESDFADIASYGFNMVRVPVGYWAFETLAGDPYVLGAQAYLDKAIQWAHQHGLKVWIDLHGAPGSQNGFDNSGQFLADKPGWQKRVEYVELTKRVLRQIYAKYGAANVTQQYGDTVLGVEVLNEPLGPLLSMLLLEAFYNDTYADARLDLATNNTVIFHDAFQAAGYWDDFLAERGLLLLGRLQNYNILIDHHHYEVFSAGQLAATIAEHIASIVSYASGIEAELLAHPAVVGEWSAALTDCTPWLNSVHYGTRWEGTYPYSNSAIDNGVIGSCADINTWDRWSEKHKVNTRKFVEIQLDQYESKAHGWIFWCYKTETSIEWDFKRLAEYGLFPQPFSDRKYIVNGTDTKPSASAAPRVAVNWGIIAVLVVFAWM